MDVDALVVDTCVRLHPTVFPKNSLNRKDCCLYDTASCNMTNKHQRSEGYPPPHAQQITDHTAMKQQGPQNRSCLYPVKPVKLATLVIRPHYYRTGKVL